MDSVVLCQVAALHVRFVQETGFRLRHRGRDFYTGTVVAQLDERAPVPGNLALIDLASGRVKIRWAVTATLPFVADAYARGHLRHEDTGPVRAVFDEEGCLLDGDDGFDTSGPGRVLDGSLFRDSQMIIVNHAEMLADQSGGLRGRLRAGEPVSLAFAPESASLEIQLPPALGGSRQQLNLVGGFTLRAVLALPRGSRAEQASLDTLVPALS